jgi:hypothetical protein
MRMRQYRKSCGLPLLGLATLASAAAPLLLRTPGYESPVHAEPDDLLMIAGTGFQPSDRVVYQAFAAAETHPPAVPARNTAEAGIAPVVQQGSPPDAITVRLPTELLKRRAYRLWVVTSGNEWSEPVAINDPRPQWITPAYVYSTADFAGLGRVIRVVGRNLAAAAPESIKIRLRGTNTAYTLVANAASADSAVSDYVAEASLPNRIAPGVYSISVRRDGLTWIDVRDQKLEVRPDPPAPATFTLGDPAFGACQPNDSVDDSSCFAQAVAAAGRAGGGIVSIPSGTWDLSTEKYNNEAATDGFIIPRHVQLRGAGRASSLIIRHGAVNRRRPDALLTLVGDNTVTGLGFSDDVHFNEWADARPVIQLGSTRGTAEANSAGSHLIQDIVISGDAFLHVGRAITGDSGRPIARLFITGNEFGAYADAIGLPGSGGPATEPFRIDDSVIRGNRFVPGSYIDVTTRQGTMASGMGAAYRVDFSANIADGTSTTNLQDPGDPSGFRAAFFWNMNNSVELMLVAGNQVACSGDKDGDGEAFGFDASGDTLGFNGAPAIGAAGADWVAVRAALIHEQGGSALPATYYNGHWVEIVAGPGMGQTRKITSYSEDAATGTVIFHVKPGWDITPAPGAGRMVVGRQYWQVLVVGNDIEHRSPPCHKSNRTGPNGGVIAVWAPSADFVVAANQQRDANGIVFTQGYSSATPSCPACVNVTFYQTALEIRDNTIDGEYDWSVDCGQGGIWGSFGASRTPESPPPVVGFGISISHNVIARADGLRGGAINFPMTTFQGPPPGDWAFIENLLIFHNRLRDIAGPPPRPKCFYGQLKRTAVRFEGKDNVRDSVLYANECERVDSFLADGGKGTKRICSANSCECRAGQ